MNDSPSSQTKVAFEVGQFVYIVKKDDETYGVDVGMLRIIEVMSKTSISSETGEKVNSTWFVGEEPETGTKVNFNHSSNVHASYALAAEAVLEHYRDRARITVRKLLAMKQKYDPTSQTTGPGVQQPQNDGTMVPQAPPAVVLNPQQAVSSIPTVHDGEALVKVSIEGSTITMKRSMVPNELLSAIIGAA